MEQQTATYSTQDLLGNPQFLRMSLDDKVAHLSQVDPDFAKAPDDQKYGYLEHVLQSHLSAGSSETQQPHDAEQTLIAQNKRGYERVPSLEDDPQNGFRPRAGYKQASDVTERNPSGLTVDVLPIEPRPTKEHVSHRIIFPKEPQPLIRVRPEVRPEQDVAAPDANSVVRQSKTGLPRISASMPSLAAAPDAEPLIGSRAGDVAGSSGSDDDLIHDSRIKPVEDGTAKRSAQGFGSVSGTMTGSPASTEGNLIAPKRAAADTEPGFGKILSTAKPQQPAPSLITAAPPAGKSKSKALGSMSPSADLRQWAGVDEPSITARRASLRDAEASTAGLGTVQPAPQEPGEGTGISKLNERLLSSLGISPAGRKAVLAMNMGDAQLTRYLSTLSRKNLQALSL